MLEPRNAPLSEKFKSVIIYHLYYWERVKGHWTSTIASNRDQVITVAIIDFNRLIWYVPFSVNLVISLDV